MGKEKGSGAGQEPNWNFGEATCNLPSQPKPLLTHFVFPQRLIFRDVVLLSCVALCVPKDSFNILPISITVVLGSALATLKWVRYAVE